ncbi:hypothetical protein EUGRSUZ_E02341 [Eucalyptus grandis]|uniref:Uncharacterized protein n=2 Tax=Eucalyptus grandis TaxID=71139 RepID=A0ACC3KYZ2_EUCGR|nr:hypothetical protein EUGRSUZ_E02341 [Eucalyptus grandis]
MTLYNVPVYPNATLSLNPYNAPVHAGATQSRRTFSNGLAKNVRIFGATQSLTTSSEEFVRNLLVSEEPPSLELRETCSRVGNTSPVVSRSFSDGQEASCSRVSDAVSVVSPYCPGRNLREWSVQDYD